MGYCSTSDVISVFPRFQADLPNGVQTPQIQSWIDQGKAEIRAKFLKRGYDPDAPATLNFNPPISVLTTDQLALLQKMNTAYGVKVLGGVLYSALTESELAVVKRFILDWQFMVEGIPAIAGTAQVASELDQGNYDALFDQDALLSITRASMGGDAGAGDAPLGNYSPDAMVETRFFWRGGPGNALKGTTGF